MSFLLWNHCLSSFVVVALVCVRPTPFFRLCETSFSFFAVTASVSFPRRWRSVFVPSLLNLRKCCANVESRSLLHSLRSASLYSSSYGPTAAPARWLEASALSVFTMKYAESSGNARGNRSRLRTPFLASFNSTTEYSHWASCSGDIFLLVKWLEASGYSSHK